MDIDDLMLISPFLLLIYGVWQHNNISMLARDSARHCCQQAGVQLLDQNILLKSIRIQRSAHALWAFKRHYRFEFSSVGDTRYQGWIDVLGNRVIHSELEPFKTRATIAHA